jgi:hypothetical protein
MLFMEKDGHNIQKGKKWATRFGIAGFLFFSIKGLLWILVPAIIVWWSAV